MNKFVVAVEYLDNTGPQYDFFCNIKGIKKGDVVVARSRHGLGICRVLSIKKHGHKASAWIISKVDEAGHERRIGIEREQQVLNERMRDYVEQMAEAQLFTVIAQSDPKMFNMLNQWHNLETQKNGRG